MDPTNKNLRLVVFAAIFGILVMPAIVWPAVYFPFILPKAMYVHLIVALTLPAYILLVQRAPEYGPTKNPLYVALTAQVLVLALTVVFAADPHRAFWGSSERMGGLFTFINFFAWTTMASGTLRTWTDWRRFLNAAVIALTVWNVWGHYTRGVGEERESGFFGNAAYLGEMQIPILFMLGLLALRTPTVMWRLAYGVGAVIAAAFLVASGTRGAMLGVAAGATVTTVAMVALLKDRKVKLTVAGLGGGILAAYGAVAVFGVGRQTQFFQEFYKARPLVGRLFIILGPGSQGAEFAGSADARKFIWETAWEAFKARPILGWGLDNFHIASGRHFHVKSFELGAGWADQTHNLLLDVLSMTGVVGLVAWIGVWGSVYYMLARAWRQGKIHGPVFAVMLGFPSGLLASKSVLFDHITSFIATGIIFALVISLSRGIPELAGPVVVEAPLSEQELERNRKERRLAERREKKKRSPEEQVTPVVLPGLSPVFPMVLYAAALVILVLTTVLPTLASARLVDADMAAHGTQPRLAYASAKSAFETISIYRYDVVYQLTDTFTGVLDPFLKDPEGKKALELLRSEGHVAMREHRMDSRLWARFGNFLTRYGAASGDKAILNEAREVLSHSVDLAPERADFRVMLARVHVYTGDVAAATEELTKATSLDPGVGHVWFMASALWLELGKFPEAVPYLVSARKARAPWKAPSAQIANIYAQALAMKGEKELMQKLVPEIEALTRGGENMLLDAAKAYERMELMEERDTILWVAMRDPQLAPKLRPVVNGKLKRIEQAFPPASAAPPPPRR